MLRSSTFPTATSPSNWINIFVYRSNHGLTSSSPAKLLNLKRSNVCIICQAWDSQKNKERIYQETTNKLLTYNTAELRKVVAEKTISISLGYLTWLSKQEDRALEKLGGELMQIRGELEECQYNLISQKIQLEEALTKIPQTGQQLEITKKYFLQIQQKADELSDTIRKSKQISTVQIIGRKQLQSQDDINQITSLSVAERILQVLLQIDDKDVRVSTIKEACTPPSAQELSQDSEIEDEEFLFATPLQLLQSIQKITKTSDSYLKIHGYENMQTLKQEIEYFWQQSMQ
eukprot:TRINITY_DN2342_c2_g1_i2.p1 TRINITY_DN2342_c2_g1~~TRINITY_DN2342_c2_g1_i2.p1  ORF type:complete len:289 (+),score=9.53 TRINITY_DN2342_c2_g1_i2:83-949(+)